MVAVVVWSFGMSYGLLRAIKAVMGLRVDADEEEIGLDLSQHSETAYVFGSSSGRIHHDERVVAPPVTLEPTPAGLRRGGDRNGRGPAAPAPADWCSAVEVAISAPRHLPPRCVPRSCGTRGLCTRARWARRPRR